MRHQFMRVGGGTAYDSDALAYIIAVQAADAAAGQSGGLEAAVKDAINAFVVGCKADGIWGAIKASCILAGARTLQGCLAPLVGTAPTNVNFVAGDYNRKTGLIGNGSTKYLNSNRANNADPQNNAHRSVWVSTGATINGSNYYGSNGSTTIGGDNLTFNNAPGIINTLRGTSRNSTGDFGFLLNNQGNTTGLKGISRSTSSSYIVRTGGTNTTVNVSSATPTSENIAILARTPSAPAFHSNARLAFYSIGESLNLALVDARFTTLINAFAAAIP